MATRKTHDGFASSAKRWKYDVFLSFRGIDTRHKFTGHLYMRLKEAGIIAFLDDSDLRRGEVITEELIKAIESSKISVVVFSKRYGDSRWCLDELVEILGCKKRFNQMVLPIFYDVDPTDIRKQTGSFGEAFDLKHKDKDPKKVQSWRDALTEASNLSGWDLRNTANGNEPKFIKMIVDQIIAELPSTNLLSVARHPVGINARLQHLTSRLRIESRDDTCMIGIVGMGGIGKTALAKAIYNKFYDEFHGKVSFLENVRETAKLPNGLVGLQNQLLADTLKPNRPKVGVVARGKEVIKQRLQRIRVLIILDDIDEENQLDALAGNSDWFGPGSRIIITTRDQNMIKRVPKGSIYQVQPMHKGEALELFSWHAFGNCCPKEGYHELSTSVVSCCGNLPLALEVIGSLLFGKDTQVWEQEIETLKRIPDGKILEKLRLSYNRLSNSHRQKDIFLDIACFFIGMDRNYVTQILDGCDFFAARGIRILLERCLITISDRNKLMMHDFLRDMGREIVRESHLDEPEKRSRLWHPKDVEDVLSKHRGTDRIEGLCILNLQSSEEKSYRTMAFKNMTRLRLLQLNYVKLTGYYKHLPKMLRWLCWQGFPLNVIPSDMELQNLVVLDLRYSKLTHVWEESGYLLEKLKILKLSHSHALKRSPNFSTVPNLEKLIMKDCRSLCEIDESIGKLKRLSLVNVQDCKLLMSLPDSFSELKSIETLVFSGCSSCLAVSLISLFEMLQLRTSPADDAAIRCISIPSPICRFEASALRELFLRDCNLTDSSIPPWTLNLFQLDLGRNNFENLKNLGGLKVYSLVLSECVKLRSIEDLPNDMTHLALSYCPALELIPEHPGNSRLLLELFGSRKFIEGSHSDSWLDRSKYIRMEGHYHNIPDAKKILLKGCSWNAIIGGGLSFPGNQIPAHCPYVNNRGDAVSFRMPFGGSSVFFVCFVYSSSISEHESDEGRIVIVNHTNSTCLVAFPKYVYATCSDVKYLWFGNMSTDELHLEAGDRVSIKVVVGEHYEVHKIGVKLIDATIIDLITKVPLQFAMAERLFGVGSFNVDGGYGNEGNSGYDDYDDYNGGYDDYDDYNGDYDDYDDYDGGYGADDIVDEAGPSSGPVKGKRRLGSYTRGKCVSQEKKKQRRLSKDGYEDNYADQLIRVLEKNNEMMAAQLEAQNKNCQLEREQNNNFLAVIKSLTDALVRMADKLPSEKS